MTHLEVTRENRRWWDFPWTAYMYEGSRLLWARVGHTRRGAIRRALREHKKVVTHRETIKLPDLQ